jgi:hypothetical protein
MGGTKIANARRENPVLTVELATQAKMAAELHNLAGQGPLPKTHSAVLAFDCQCAP